MTDREKWLLGIIDANAEIRAAARNVLLIGHGSGRSIRARELMDLLRQALVRHDRLHSEPQEKRSKR